MFVGGHNIGGPDGTAVMEEQVLAQLEDPAPRALTSPASGQVGLVEAIGPFTGQRGEDQPADSRGMGVHRVARVETFGGGLERYP